MSPFDIERFARAVNARRIAYECERGRRAGITPAMSRILENDAAYIPYRRRKEDRRRHMASNPTIATVVDIAARLETTVGALLGEKAYCIGIADRRELRRVLLYLFRLFDLDSPELRLTKR